MVTIKSPLLTSFAKQRNDLLDLLAIKTSALKVTSINKNFDNKYRADTAHVTELLRSIEDKFKHCETLYYIYFENAEHGELSGNITALPVEVDCSLLDGTTATKH